MSTTIKFIGFIYYIGTSITIFISLHIFSRLFQKPNPNFYKNNKSISFLIIIFYSLINLYLFYLFFKKNYSNYIIYLLNEIITISFSYLVLSGFHVYGIIGQICSGKTTASEYLKKRYKATIISLDEIKHKILIRRDIIRKIKKKFGNEVIIKDNGVEKIDRIALRNIIHESKQMKKRLENIVNPEIIIEFFKIFFTQRFLYRKKFIFIENAISLRFNLFKIILKGTILIAVENENVLIERIIKRDNREDNVISEETAKNFLRNRMSLNEYKNKADIIIYNDDSYQKLESNIDEVMKNIIQYHKNDKIFVNWNKDFYKYKTIDIKLTKEW